MHGGPMIDLRAFPSAETRRQPLPFRLQTPFSRTLAPGDTDLHDFTAVGRRPTVYPLVSDLLVSSPLLLRLS
jgi:hypothetical protein